MIPVWTKKMPPGFTTEGIDIFRCESNDQAIWM